MKLNKKDYITILEYYKINIPVNAKLHEIQILAEDIIAEKLCRCIKKVQKIDDEDESRAIAICKNSILGNKKLKISRFTCKKKPKLFKNNLKKTRIIKIHN